MQSSVYPAIFTTEAQSLDGVRVEIGADPTELQIRNNRGRPISTLQPFEEQEIGADRWLVRGFSAQAGAEITALIERSERRCGCGGPKRSSATAAQLEDLASWPDRDLPV